MIEHIDGPVVVSQADRHYAGIRAVTPFRGMFAVRDELDQTGTVTAWFRQWGEGPIPLADATRDIVVALVHVDDSGEVRWARRIFG